MVQGRVDLLEHSAAARVVLLEELQVRFERVLLVALKLRLGIFEPREKLLRRLNEAGVSALHRQPARHAQPRRAAMSWGRMSLLLCQDPSAAAWPARRRPAAICKQTPSTLPNPETVGHLRAMQSL